MATSQHAYIIFGTSRGLGKAISKNLLKNRHNNIIGINRDQCNLARPIPPQRIQKLLQRSLKKAGKVDTLYLITNASVIDPIGYIGSIDSHVMQDAICVNYLNYLTIINEFLSLTNTIHCQKRICLISSGAAGSPNAGLATYCSTKAGIEMFVSSIWKEREQDESTRIIAFRPGVIDTGMQRKMRNTPEKRFPRRTTYQQLHAQGKLLSPDEVAQKLYTLLHEPQRWTKPIIDIRELSPES